MVCVPPPPVNRIEPSSAGLSICRTQFTPGVDCHDSLRELLAPLTTNKEDDYGRKFVHRGRAARNSAITAKSS
jgi:hypothetical protein